MKRVLLFLGIFAFATAFKIQPFEDVIKAIKSGDASQVSQYFDNTLEITFADKSSSYNRNQAEEALQSFFSSNAVKDFEILHTSDNAGAKYCIGNLKTANGTYRTTIFMKQKGNKTLLQELRFEK
ncbi:MAG TPA: DUF4783 domain-containing protein [Chitinophagaceae bacterium]|nr:DUF4783 domain-containing protein [Chitinophagaceae bacterium]